NLLGNFALRILLPRGLSGGKLRMRRVELLLKLCYTLGSAGQLRRLLGRRQHQAGVSASHDSFIHIGEVSAKRIEIAHGERIEFVIVALAAARRLAEPDRSDRSDAVGKVTGFVILRLCPTLFRRQEQPVEGRADAGLLACVGKKVTGKLLTRKSIERFV